MNEPETGVCSLCERKVPREMITLHHLKPRETGGRAEPRTPLCRPCHKQLTREIDSVDRLKGRAAAPAVPEVDP